jgi:hypothetical protein
LRDGVDKGLGEIRGGCLAAEVGEGVNDDVLEVSFIGEPFDVLYRMPKN